MSKSSVDPPPYSSAPDPTSNHVYSLGVDLQTQLSNFRTQRIHTTISTSILPLLQDRVRLGLGRTIIALLPRDSTTADATQSTRYAHDYNVGAPASKVIDIVTSHSDDDDNHIQRIQLEDPSDTGLFWCQPVVLHELEYILRETLNPQPNTTKTESITRPSSATTPTVVPPQQSKSRSSFSRKSSAMTQIVHSLSKNPAYINPSDTSRISVVVESDEICLRVQSHFGLYETLTKPAVIIRVRVQS